MEENYNLNQIYHAQSKYVDIGNASTTRRQWLRVQHRDTLCSLISHPNTMAYLGAAMPEKSQAEIRHEMILQMANPLAKRQEKRIETTAQAVDNDEMEIE